MSTKGKRPGSTHKAENRGASDAYYEGRLAFSSEGGAGGTYSFGGSGG